VTVRSGMGHSIHPARAAGAKRSWRLSPSPRLRRRPTRALNSRPASSPSTLTSAPS
jgi:hypothetical protein